VFCNVCATFDRFRDNLPTDLCCMEGVETPLTFEQTDEEINEVVKQGMTVVKQPATTEYASPAVLHVSLLLTASQPS